MAIRQSPNQRMLLSEIYEFVSQRFPYYQQSNKSWQNSIRNNLSLNECFVKIPRNQIDGGNQKTYQTSRKGSLWTLRPGYEDMFEQGTTRRRKSTKLQDSLQE